MLAEAIQIIDWGDSLDHNITVFNIYSNIISGAMYHSQKRMTVNHDATGSSPVTGAKKPHSQAVCGVLLCLWAMIALFTRLLDLYKNLPNELFKLTNLVLYMRMAVTGRIIRLSMYFLSKEVCL